MKESAFFLCPDCGMIVAFIRDDMEWKCPLDAYVFKLKDRYVPDEMIQSLDKIVHKTLEDLTE